MNKAFVEYLERYTPDEKMLVPLRFEFKQLYYKANEEKFEDEKRLNEQLKEVSKKIDTVEEKFYVLNEMSKETFDKFYPKYQKERQGIVQQLQNTTHVISNLSESISKILTFSTKLNTVWTSKELKVVEGLQKLIFPQGIYYDKKTREFRTEKVNVIFQHIASAKLTSEEKEKGTNHFLDGSSLSAETEAPVPFP